ncbi:hypothetical protein ACFL3H_00380 [Gemmatimonadota bacterium]
MKSASDLAMEEATNDETLPSCDTFGGVVTLPDRMWIGGEGG